MSHPIIIVGAGGHARETAHAHLLEATADTFLGFLDDRTTGITPEGWPILGPVDMATRYLSASFLIAINDPRTRRAVCERLHVLGVTRWASVIHPDVHLHASVRCGVGCSILGGAQLTTHIRIGDHCILNRGIHLSHDCTIGSFCSLNPTACVAGNVTIGDGCELGSGCLVRQGTSVGVGSTLGMGAVVVRSVDANTVVVGNPARVLRSSSPW